MRIKRKKKPTRQLIKQLCGKYRGMGLLKALMDEKKRELEREEERVSRFSRNPRQ